MAEKEAAETAETQTRNLFIAGADHGVGLVLVAAASKRGYKVVGSTARGTEGAMRIRSMGGVPTYTDFTRGGSVRSNLLLAKAEVVINCLPQDLGGLPQYRLDYDRSAHHNLVAAQTLASISAAMGIQRLIQVSPGFVYGSTDSPATEEQSIHPHGSVMEAMAQAEAAVLDGAVPGYVVRAGYIYGGWHDATVAMREVLLNGQGVVKGHQPVSWVHEEDLAAALLALVEKEFSEEATANIYNVADDHPSSPDEFMRLFGTAYGPGEPGGIPGFLHHFRVPAFQREQMEQQLLIDSGKARDELGWQPQYPTQEAGIERTLLVWRAQETAEAADDETESKELSPA